MAQTAESFDKSVHTHHTTLLHNPLSVNEITIIYIKISFVYNVMIYWTTKRII